MWRWGRLTRSACDLLFWRKRRCFYVHSSVVCCARSLAVSISPSEPECTWECLSYLYPLLGCSNGCAAGAVLPSDRTRSNVYRPRLPGSNTLHRENVFFQPFWMKRLYQRVRVVELVLLRMFKKVFLPLLVFVSKPVLVFRVRNMFEWFVLLWL